MKNLVLITGLINIHLLSLGQQFVNGELNTFGIYMSASNEVSFDGWNDVFDGASWYGTGKSACLENLMGNTSANIRFYNEFQFCWNSNLSVKLNQPLEAGVTYRLRYSEKYDLDTPMKIELSHFQNTPGIEIGQMRVSNIFLWDWRENNIEFTPTEDFQYFNFILDHESSAYPNSIRCLDNFILEIINDPHTTDIDPHVKPYIKYDVFGLDGKLLFAKVYISNLPSGVYILKSGNEVLLILLQDN